MTLCHMLLITSTLTSFHALSDLLSYYSPARLVTEGKLGICGKGSTTGQCTTSENPLKKIPCVLFVNSIK